MDRLEEFIIENRGAFDKEVPSLKVWAHIDQQLEKKQAPRIRRMRFLRAAAAIALVLTAGCAIGFYLNGVSSSDPVAERSLADVAPEFAELEQYYASQVSLKMQELATFQHADAVQSDMQQLDELFQELATELDKAPEGAEERIINAMIDNYQTRLEILERVLEKIQSTNQPLNSESNEISI